ncbi:oxygenase [Lithospermum erythrorhizon]|uniref:Oxygenase n=1 Tax=Lithospermum erythrorhizon TaxID=34254 RepID=A0AAV3PF78_LITER
MLPAALQHSHRIYDYTTEVLTEIGGTIWFRGPSFSGSDMLITSDPSNVHHVLSKNFSNYPKSDDFREIFEVFGDGIINAEPRLWELERKAILSFFTNKNFHHLMEKTTWNKIETGFSRFLTNSVTSRLSLISRTCFRDLLLIVVLSWSLIRIQAVFPSICLVSPVKRRLTTSLELVGLDIYGQEAFGSCRDG